MADQLSDEMLMSIKDDPVYKAKLSPEERGRLSALQAKSVGAPHPEAKMGAAVTPMGEPNMTLAPDRVDAMGMRKLVSPDVEQFMREPIARPTGIDAVDSMLSPGSLALIGASEGPRVLSALKGLTDQVGGTVTRKLLKFVLPSALKKPAELADLLNEVAQAMKTNGAPPATPTPPAAPRPSVPTPAAPNAMDTFLASKAPATVEAAPAPTPAAPAAAPTNAMPNQRVINDLGLAAARAKTTMTLDEIKALVPKVEGGMRPAEAVAEFAQQRVAAAPAKTLADLPGTMTDADVQAALDARHQRGEIKTPSAQTARARRMSQSAKTNATDSHEIGILRDIQRFTAEGNLEEAAASQRALEGHRAEAGYAAERAKLIDPHEQGLLDDLKRFTEEGDLEEADRVLQALRGHRTELLAGRGTAGKTPRRGK